MVGIIGFPMLEFKLLASYQKLDANNYNVCVVESHQFASQGAKLHEVHG